VAAVVVVHDDSRDDAIDAIDDRQGDNAEIDAFDVPHQVGEIADAVLHEDAELAKASPPPAAGGQRIDRSRSAPSKIG
jgi:hypothetical protein